MKVKELIEALSKFDGELEVIFTGSDAYYINDIVGVMEKLYEDNDKQFVELDWQWH